MEQSSKVRSNKEGASVKNAVVRPAPVFMTLHVVFIAVKSTQPSWKPTQVQLILLGAMQSTARLNTCTCPASVLRSTALIRQLQGYLHSAARWKGRPAKC